MATTYKVLGQSNPLATTLTTLYTVPSATSTVVSTINVCNFGVSTTFRVSIRPAGAAQQNYHYLYYDIPVNANDALSLSLGLTLAATDVVTVYAGTATMAFSLFGAEIA